MATIHRYTESIEKKDGNLMTIGEFKENVKSGRFIDYDGWGYPVKNDLYMKRCFFPSEIDRIPKDATHFLWFNK